jgi:peptidoglycan/LPS O-acetylase OafA/YrhL
LPLELCCYVLLGLIALLGIFGNTVIIASTMVVICIASFAYDFVHSIDRVVIFRIVVVEAFFVGVAFFRLRERIPVNMGLFLVSLAVTGVLVFIPHGAFFVALPLVYVTIYLGLPDPGRNRILLSGDYSYGIYLYGVPIQQAVVAALPALKFGIMQFLVAFPITLVLAIFSWWLIEKPVLKLRRWLPVFETHIKIGLNKFISERRRLSATQTK